MSTSSVRRPVRLLQLSDPHLFETRDQQLLNVDTSASLAGVVHHIHQHEQHVDIVLATGDITQDGSASAHEQFIQKIRPLAPTIRGLPGNHDISSTFYKQWGRDAQTITDIDRWRLVLLNSTVPGSNAGHLANDQLDLLKQACRSAGERHILIAVHHNPLPMGSRWLDTMMIDNGHALFSLIANQPQVRGLLWGHVHQEFDSVYSVGSLTSGTAKRRHVRLLAAPATSVQFLPQSTAFSLDSLDPGYRWLNLQDNGDITTGVVRVPGLGLRPDVNSAGY